MRNTEPKLKKVAIFDIDGTIFRSSLLIELVHVLIEQGSFPPGVKRHYEREEEAWLDRKGDYDAYIRSLVLAFIKHIKGVHFEDFEKATDTVIERYRHRVYRFTRDLIRTLKKKGYFLLAISHSPKGIIDRFCDEFGFDKAYGTFYELGPLDRFTGKVLEEHLIMNKANIVRRSVEKEGLTLEGSIGVGDTESDIPFLDLVERPICFNPNAALFRHAKRNKWEVVVERKDVVYDIQK